MWLGLARLRQQVRLRHDARQRLLANPPFPRQDCPFDEGEAELTAFMGGKWAAFAKGEAPWWPFMAGGGTKIAKARGGRRDVEAAC